jgi:hypothetical protein
MKVTTFAKLAGGLSERSLPCTAIRKQETRNFLEIFYLKLLPELKGQKFERLLNLTKTRNVFCLHSRIRYSYRAQHNSIFPPGARQMVSTDRLVLLPRVA